MQGDLLKLEREKALREQEVSARLVEILQAHDTEKAEITRLHDEQLRAHEQQQAEQETALRQSLSTLQGDLLKLEREKALREQELLQQIATTQAEKIHLEQESMRREEKLNGALSLIQSEVQTVRHTLAYEQQMGRSLEESLEKIQATVSWRMTAPLRAVATFCSSAIKRPKQAKNIKAQKSSQ